MTVCAPALLGLRHWWSHASWRGSACILLLFATIRVQVIRTCGLMAAELAAAWNSGCPDLSALRLDQLLGVELTIPFRVKSKDCCPKQMLGGLCKYVAPNAICGLCATVRCSDLSNHAPKCEDLIRNHWLLVPLLQRWPARVPPAGAIQDAFIHLCQLVDVAGKLDSMWVHQQTIIVQRLLVKLRRLTRKSPRSRNRILAMLKQLVIPSRRKKDSRDCFASFMCCRTLLIHDLQ